VTRQAVNPEIDTPAQIVQKFSPVVRYITNKMKKRIPPSVQADDLVQAGMIGLLQSIDNFSAKNGASFFTFASIRIRGAILDELRKTDTCTRTLRRKATAAKKATVALQNRALRPPRHSEVAAAIGMKMEEYDRVRVALAPHDDEESILERYENDSVLSPLQIIESEEKAAEVAAAIDRLPARERQVIALLYEQDMDTGQAAQAMGVTSCRISQIHFAAINLLRKSLNQPPLMRKTRAGGHV